MTAGTAHKGNGIGRLSRILFLAGSQDDLIPPAPMYKLLDLSMTTKDGKAQGMFKVFDLGGYKMASWKLFMSGPSVADNQDA